MVGPPLKRKKMFRKMTNFGFLRAKENNKGRLVTNTAWLGFPSMVLQNSNTLI
jgi:hypothetical protein